MGNCHTSYMSVILQWKQEYFKIKINAMVYILGIIHTMVQYNDITHRKHDTPQTNCKIKKGKIKLQHASTLLAVNNKWYE